MAKKIKIPDTVKDLKLSPKKFGKKIGIRINKGMPKKERKFYTKKLWNKYGKMAAEGLNDAMHILSENNPEEKKMAKVVKRVDGVLESPKTMNVVIKRYKKNPNRYPDMIHLPRFIISTVDYYNSTSISEAEKREMDEKFDTEKLIDFSYHILKKPIKYYENRGVADVPAFRLAAAVPSARVFNKSRFYYRNAIEELYKIAALDPNQILDLNVIIPSMIKVDKTRKISKKEFLRHFCFEFICMRLRNKDLMEDSQRALNTELTSFVLDFLDSMKPHSLKELLKEYITVRKKEEYKNLKGTHPINFVEHAAANSPYLNIQNVVQDILEKNNNFATFLSTERSVRE